ncbi:MAG: glycosyltransferase family 9 protein [Candidatus Omnitrophica bacterium]|nr:glycosyltransferase family 9 protein [Candidatus Omnitrophota bacterium]
MYKRILVINPFGIGDVLFTTPLVRALEENYPHCFIGYWCNERVKTILENNKNIDRIFALSRGDLKKIFARSWFEGIAAAIKLFSQIKGCKFDTAFDFSLDHRYGLVARLAGIKTSIGYNYKGRGRFLTQRIGLEGYQNKHVVEYYSDLLRFAGISGKSKNLELTVSDENLKKAEDLLRSRGIRKGDLAIGIAPGAGASWGRDAGYKHWPALKFAQVADSLAKDLVAKVVILGDTGEEAIADVVINAAANQPIDLTGKTTLDVLPGVIKNLKVLICNDGGPLHMAVALGVKTVSIFGPVDELVYGPYPPSPEHKVLKWDMKCRPCYKNFRMSACDKDRECLRSISVEQVLAGVKEVLNK